MRTRLVSLTAIALALAAATSVALPAGSEQRTTVYAAASLRDVLPALDAAPRYSFAGSATLRRQVEAGAPADVFAAASPREPATLARAGRCATPLTFATNRLTLIVPAGGSRVRSVAGLRRPGLRLALAAPAVPAGAYARTALARLNLTAALRRIRVSSEPDVKSVVAKVALGSADAGIAYVTDARAAAGRVDAVALPAAAQPAIRYQACAVRRPGADAPRARAFLAHLTSPAGRRALRRAGFGLPPG